MHGRLGQTSGVSAVATAPETILTRGVVALPRLPHKLPLSQEGFRPPLVPQPKPFSDCATLQRLVACVLLTLYNVLCLPHASCQSPAGFIFLPVPWPCPAVPASLPSSHRHSAVPLFLAPFQLSRPFGRVYAGLGVSLRPLACEFHLISTVTPNLKPVSHSVIQH